MSRHDNLAYRLVRRSPNSLERTTMLSRLIYDFTHSLRCVARAENFEHAARAFEREHALPQRAFRGVAPAPAGDGCGALVSPQQLSEPRRVDWRITGGVGRIGPATFALRQQKIELVAMRGHTSDHVLRSGAFQSSRGCRVIEAVCVQLAGRQRVGSVWLTAGDQDSAQGG